MDLFDINKENTLDALLSPDHSIKHRKKARQFLNDLIAISPRESFRTLLPVATRLLHFKQWPSWDRTTIRDYCVLRMHAVELLETLPVYREDETGVDYDPSIEFMVGMVTGLVQKLKRDNR